MSQDIRDQLIHNQHAFFLVHDIILNDLVNREERQDTHKETVLPKRANMTEGLFGQLQMLRTPPSL